MTLKNYLKTSKESMSSFYILQKVSKDEYGVSYAWIDYDDELGEEVIKVECNEDRLCIENYIKGNKLFFNFLEDYNEASENYLYKNSFSSSDSIVSLYCKAIKHHLDFWLMHLSSKKILNQFNVFKYDDMADILSESDSGSKYMIFVF